MALTWRTAKTLALVVAGGAALTLTSPPQARATHEPADKINVSASTVEVMQTQVGLGASSQQVTLLSATFRNSTPVFVGDAIRLFQKTRSANAFNWGALNVGNGIHTLVVKAQLDASVTGVGTFAQAAVGKRTLVVQPAKLANDAQF